MLLDKTQFARLREAQQAVDQVYACVTCGYPITPQLRLELLDAKITLKGFVDELTKQQENV